MQTHQRRIPGRVADEIEAYRAGRQSLLAVLNRTWGLFEAAEVRLPADRQQFMDVYYALSIGDDTIQPWVPAGLGSDEEVAAALDPLEAWAIALRDTIAD